MSETATVIIKNNSGRSIDSIVMWHTSSEPTPLDLAQTPLIQSKNLASGDNITAQAQLSWGSPTDYWTSGVLFQGDGTTYIVCGVVGDPYKEYEVSDGSTITFNVEEYTSNTTNQSNIQIDYTGDDGGMAFLLNPDTVIAIDALKLVAEIISHLR